MIINFQIKFANKTQKWLLVIHNIIHFHLNVQAKHKKEISYTCLSSISINICKQNIQMILDTHIFILLREILRMKWLHNGNTILIFAPTLTYPINPLPPLILSPQNKLLPTCTSIFKVLQCSSKWKYCLSDKQLQTGWGAKLLDISSRSKLFAYGT